MTTGHVFIATSLDGFVARPDHRIDWLTKQPDAGHDLGYESFSKSVDGIVMGRGSYENVLTFGDWPYKVPTMVMSKTLRQSDVAEDIQDKVTITALDPEPLMTALDDSGWSRAYVDGGKVVQSFINEGLIEDMVITTVPILIGQGIRLFGPLAQDIDLELTKSASFDNGLVQSTYRLVKPARA